MLLTKRVRNEDLSTKAPRLLLTWQSTTWPEQRNSGQQDPGESPRGGRSCSSSSKALHREACCGEMFTDVNPKMKVRFLDFSELSSSEGRRAWARAEAMSPRMEKKIYALITMLTKCDGLGH